MEVVGWNAHSIIIETANRESSFPINFCLLKYIV